MRTTCRWEPLASAQQATLPASFSKNAISSRFQFVPYRSAGLAIRDLVAGQIDMNLDTPATSGPLVRNGLIKAYAVTAKTRSPVIPEVPSVDEAGLPGFYFGFW